MAVVLKDLRNFFFSNYFQVSVFSCRVAAVFSEQLFVSGADLYSSLTAGLTAGHCQYYYRQLTTQLESRCCSF